MVKVMKGKIADLVEDRAISKRLDRLKAILDKRKPARTKNKGP